LIKKNIYWIEISKYHDGVWLFVHEKVYEMEMESWECIFNVVFWKYFKKN
jgi:hypothetical protein